MNVNGFVAQKSAEAIKSLYNAGIEASAVQTQATRKEFEGDVTVVVFPLLKVSHKSPDVTAGEIGEWLAANCPEIASYNVIKGFLNLKLNSKFWNSVLKEIRDDSNFGQLPPTGKTVMVELSSSCSISSEVCSISSPKRSSSP